MLCITPYNEKMKKWNLLLALLFVLPSYAQRQQICSITLNSDNEIKIFKNRLASENFDFIELAPQGYKVNIEEQWLRQSCQNQNVQCDVLVVSGHFADMFFGSTNKHILSVYELEKIACQNRCPRIFKNLKEVFLFGCNTMATKEKLYRSAEDYLNVLVEEHRIPPSIAETIVASRYSNFDPTYKTRMEHIFEPQTRIYGFREVSPYGKQSEKSLKNYLSSVITQYGSYTQYLQANWNRQENNFFSKSFDALSTTQQSFGMDEKHPQYSDYQNLCSLYNENLAPSIKTRVVKNIFEKGSEFFAFSAIKNFLVHSKDRLNSSSIKVLQKIQREKIHSRDKFVEAYSNLGSNLFYMKSQILHFLYLMSWIDQSHYQEELRSHLLPLIHQPSVKSYDILNTLVRENKLNSSDIIINYKDLGIDYLKNIWNVLVVDILNINSVEMQKDLMEYCEKSQKIAGCYQVLKTLGNIQATHQPTLKKMASYLESEHLGLVYYATYGLTYSNAVDADILVKIVKNLKHPNAWIRLQSLQSLDYLGVIKASFKVKQIVENMRMTEKDDSIVKEINLVLSR